MKKTGIISSFLLLLFLIQPLAAQQSIGFSDSTDFQYLIDYRLPDWGYSNFYLESGSFRTTGNYYQNDSDLHPTGNTSVQTNNRTSNSHDVRINLAPAYRYYRQSEERTLSLDTQLGVNARAYNSKSEIERLLTSEEKTDTLRYEQQEQYSNSFGSNYYLDFNVRHFLAGDFFLLTSLETDIQYEWGDLTQEDTREGRTNSQTDDTERLANVNPGIGVGFGRLRNIAPQLRAIRLNERYRSIGDWGLNE